jgi:uncharacterized protein DUF1573
MRRATLPAITVGLIVALGAAAQPRGPAQPVPATQPAAATAPWANKFFLRDIAANREQSPPAAIVHNFGEVPHGTVCTHTFPITNIYDVPMQITEVRKSCTCLDYVPLTKILQPNETAEFTVTMNTGKFVGFNAQTVYVTFGPKYVSTAVLRLQATSRTDVSINPGGIAFGTVAQGTRPAQSVNIKYTGKMRDWKLTEIVPVQGPFDVKVTEVSRGGPFRGGAEFQVEVTLKPSAKPGPISEHVQIKTTDSAHPVVQVAVTANIASPIELAPGKVRFETIAVGQSASQRVIVRAARPFKVVGIDGAGAGVTVELPTGSAQPVQFITVKFEPKQAGPVARTLRIRTDLDGGIATLPVEGAAAQ